MQQGAMDAGCQKFVPQTRIINTVKRHSEVHKAAICWQATLFSITDDGGEGIYMIEAWYQAPEAVLLVHIDVVDL